MIHHVMFFKLNPEVTPEKLETMMRQTRAQLLKIGEVLSLQCGKNIDPKNEWGFFFAVDVESTEKLALYMESATLIKFMVRVIKPNTREQQTFDFETDPARDIRFS